MKNEIYSVCFDQYNTKNRTLSYFNIIKMFNLDEPNNVLSPNPMSPNSLKKWFYRQMAKQNVEEERVVQTLETKKETYTMRGDGTITAERVIELGDDELLSPDAILRSNNFDPDKWVLASCSNSVSGISDTGKTRYNCRISVKPKVDNQPTEFSFADIDDFFQNYSRKPSPLKHDGKYVRSKDGYTLEVPLADLHLGSLSTDGDGIETTKKRFYQVIDEVYERSKSKKIKKIILAILGDFFHYSASSGRTTASGTVLSSSTLSYPQIFEMGMGLMNDAIDKLLSIADVDVVIIPGNHDSSMMYFLGKSLEYYWKNNNYVTVDSKMTNRKIRVIGNTLLGFIHGDVGTSRLSSWIQSEAREEMGKTKYTVLHMGHLHSVQTTEKDGMIVMNLPSFCLVDDWHSENLFIGSRKCSNCFLWDDDRGLEEIWYVNV